MVGLVLGFIVLVLGIGFGIFCATKKTEDYRTDKWGDPIRDEKGNKIIEVKHPLAKFSWISFIIGIAICILSIFLASTVSVPTGHTGVVTTFGRVENYTLDAGFHMKAPWHSIVSMDNRVQKGAVPA